MIGLSPSETVILELLGLPDNLTAVTMLVTAPLDRPIEGFVGVAYLGIAVEEAVPDWDRSVEWIGENITRLSSGTVQTTRGDRVITLSYDAQERTFILIVRHQQFLFR